MLAEERPSLNHEMIGAANASMWADVRIVEHAQSTNDEVTVLARAGAPEGTAVVAEHQQAGRGRLDRSFVLPARSSIPVSLLVRPVRVPLERWPWLIFVSGLVVCDAIEKAGLTAELKWPNDALIGESKVCGINMEHVVTDGGSAAVIGIGLNVSQTREELPVDRATSLALAGGRNLDRTAILLDIVQGFGERYERWRDAGGDPSVVRAEYERRCSTIGRRVRVHLPDGARADGLAEGIDASGRIVVDGTPYSAGDVVHLRSQP